MEASVCSNVESTDRQKKSENMPENIAHSDETQIPHRRKAAKKTRGKRGDADESHKSTDESSSSSSLKKLKKCHMSSELQEKLKDIPGALEYIEKLEKIINSQIKKIAKWKSKLKKNRQNKTKGTQTVLSDFYTYTDLKNDTKMIVKDTPEAPKSITDEIKEAAEEFVHNSGFVYEETSGLYYDYNTGYYYNAEYGLYYDGNSGTYMKYNQDTQSYEFHSQVSKAQEHAGVEPRQNAKHKRKLQKTPMKKVNTAASAVDALTRSFGRMRVESLRAAALDVSKQWPPCMRIIVEYSENPRIKQGSLHIVTCDGGTLGREGAHSIILPDVSVSKHHLKFTFDKTTSRYLVTDLGSRNGTLLNAKRMSPAKQESDPFEVAHGSKIQIGATVLSCHIHDGSHTCGHCEPGLVQVRQKETKGLETESLADRHKTELKKIKKQYGYFGGEEGAVKLASGYTDRAQMRRETVGSQNHNEKTQVASVDESIPTENKGFKLLSKMGWKEGQSLGKSGEGITEPIKLVSNQGTTGIGAESAPISDDSSGRNLAKDNIWKKAQERFEKISNAPADLKECEETGD